MDYSRLSGLYSQLEKTPKRLKKTALIAGLLKESKEDLKDIVYLLQGRVFPPWDKREIGISSKLMAKALANAAGVSLDKVEAMLNKEGDLGIVAENLIEKRKQTTLFSRKLTTRKVVDNIRKIAQSEGSGSVDRKIGFIAELLNSAEPEEAKYVARTVLENMRTGVGSQTLRDAIIWAFLPKIEGLHFYCNECKTFSLDRKCALCSKKADDKIGIPDKKSFHADSLEELSRIGKFVELIIPKNPENARKLYSEIAEYVQKAYDLSNDFGMIAELLRENGLNSLDEITLQPGHPIKVMLYLKAKDFKDAFETVGRPAIAERKFDGFRMQIHGNNGEIKLFTRRLDEVTAQFPDVVDAIRENIKSKLFIIDSEIVGITESGKFVPFQGISQRIKRKHDIEQMLKAFPVIIELFDAMLVNGKNLLNEPFSKRREELKRIVREKNGKIVLVEQKEVSSEAPLKLFYDSVLKEGVEGIMLKNPRGIYKPGARVGFGVKLKPLMETLDLVIVAAEWGEGKRATWLSSFTLACRKGSSFLEIGRVGTGIKEKSEEGVSFDELTEELKPLIIQGQGKGKEVKIKPKIVVEIAYQEIQKSPSYNSGFALRFPRVVRLREEKGPEDANTLKDVERLYSRQK